MRIFLRYKNTDEIEFGIIFGTIAILALVSARVLPVQEFLPSCLFKAFTGIPCPSCGITRSLVHLAYGDIAGALILNPLFSLAMISVLFLFWVRLSGLCFNRSVIMLTHSHREGTLLRVGLAGIFLANWIYLVMSL